MSGNSEFSGTFTEVERIIEIMREASKRFIMVGVQVGTQPPPAFGVSLSIIAVDVENDTYPVAGGKVALKATVLDEIAWAMGINWDGVQSGRLDDGRNPRFIEYRAVGYYRSADSTHQWTTGSKRMDLRADSDTVDSMHRNHGKGDATSQIREQRRYLLEHAESKAKARAIRKAAGIRAYWPNDLDRPFCVAKLVYTGRTGDPELDRELTLMAARAAIGAGASLYGGGAAPAALPSAPMGTGGTPRFLPPPADAEFEDDVPDEGEGQGYPPAALPSGKAESSREAESRGAKREPSPTAARKRPTGGADPSMVVPFGRAKGSTIGDASGEDLEFLEMVTAKNVGDPSKSKWRDSNAKFLAAVRAELSRRGASDAA